MTESNRDVEELAAAWQARSAGRLAEAKRICEALLGRNGANSGALRLYGALAFRAGESDAAFQIMARAVSVAPQDATLPRELGDMLFLVGREEEAIAAYRRATKLDPTLFAAQRNLAMLLHARGDHLPSIARFCKALALAPDDGDLRRRFAQTLRDVKVTPPPPGFEAELMRCFAAPDIDHQDIALAASGVIEVRPYFAALVEGMDAEGNVPALTERRAALESLIADPLLHELLVKARVVEPKMEILLTRLRRFIVLGRLGWLARADQAVEFLAALGLQCFSTGYVLHFESDEAQALETLEQELAAKLSARVSPSEIEAGLLTTTLYRPLHSLAVAEQLAAHRIDAWRTSLRPLLTRCLFEPREEMALRAQIPALGPVRDDTSRAVMTQYEEDPYPAWLSLVTSERVTLGADLRKLFPGIAWPSSFDRPVGALVAGCGTGRHPLELSLRIETNEIIAVDLSRASLAYAMRMQHRLGMEGVKFLQGDILELASLNRKFDLIECTGVLHHMAAPLEGWRVLCGLLRPHGVMRIGLYSTRARKSVVEARARVAELGLRAHAEDIRAFRWRILSGQEPQLLEHTESSDFYNLSACRDLIFHACEHRFTPREIAASLVALKLEFLGFELPPALEQAYRARWPEDSAMADLERWDILEADMPDGFAGMFIFWCRKPDSPVAGSTG